MIGALIAILSMNMTVKLIENYGITAKTLQISAATATTPILVSVPNHNIPPQRVMHGIISGSTSMPELNGLWEFSVVDSNTLSLATYTPQGVVVDSVGVNSYSGGAQITYAFPDFSMLLGRQMLQGAASVASPRIVWIPTDEPAWIYESYGGIGAPAQLPNIRGGPEQQTQTLEKLYATQCTTFEVYVTGVANPPQPNFGDLDITQLYVWILYQCLFEACTDDIASVRRGTWPSQKPNAGSNTQRGQQWMGIVQIKQPATAIAKQFVPVGTKAIVIVEPVDPLIPEDQTTITINPT